MNAARAALAAIGAAWVIVACSGTDGGSGASGSTAADGGSNGDDAGAVGEHDGAAGASDGGDATASVEASTGCGAFAGDGVFTCASDGNSRGKCEGDASLITEACDRGCLRETPPADSVCMGATDAWSCPGSYGTTRAQNGDYYLTSFGCWLDAAGTEHTDPADNCIPSCFAQAKAAGLCMAGDTGKQCEERVNWFTADGARFGCLQRLRVTNPANGKSLIAVALDFGPACSGEANVSHAVLDASGRVDQYLFGSDQGASDRSTVHVVEVDDTYALGPITP